MASTTDSGFGAEQHLELITDRARDGDRRGSEPARSAMVAADLIPTVARGDLVDREHVGHLSSLEACLSAIASLQT